MARAIETSKTVPEADAGLTDDDIGQVISIEVGNAEGTPVVGSLIKRESTIAVTPVDSSIGEQVGVAVAVQVPCGRYSTEGDPRSDRLFEQSILIQESDGLTVRQAGDN